MIFIAAAELAVILVLVLLLNRSRDHEVKAVLDVMADGTAERAELLNAARHPNYLLHREAIEPSPLSDEQLEELRRSAAAYAQVGRVAEPESSSVSPNSPFGI